MLSQLSSIDSQLSALQASRQQILLSNTSTGSAAVIDVPTTAEPQSSGLVTYTGLAVLLGLIVGLLIASTDELLRPTVSEPAAFARELECPVLGSVAAARHNRRRLDPGLLTALQLAATRAGISTVVLTGPVAGEQLDLLSRYVNYELRRIADHDRVAHGRPGRAAARSAIESHGTNGHRRVAASVGTVIADDLDLIGLRPARTVRTVTLSAVSGPTPKGSCGLVAVVPEFVPFLAVERVGHLRDASGWPLLGVIGAGKSGQRLVSKSARRELAAAEDDLLNEDLIHA